MQSDDRANADLPVFAIEITRKIMASGFSAFGRSQIRKSPLQQASLVIPYGFSLFPFSGAKLTYTGPYGLLSPR